MAAKKAKDAEKVETKSEETAEVDYASKVKPLHVGHAEYIKEQTGQDVDPLAVFLIYSTRVAYRKTSEQYAESKTAAAAAKEAAEQEKAEAKAAREAERAEKKAEKEKEKAEKKAAADAAKEEKKKKTSAEAAKEAEAAADKPATKGKGKAAASKTKAAPAKGGKKPF